MGHMYHILLADGAVVEPLSDVVAGGANQLHAALECLVVWPSANQRRQERVVNVDDLLWLRVDEVVGKNLHAPREHHEVRFVVRRSVPELFTPASICLSPRLRSHKECYKSRQLPDCRPDWRRSAGSDRQVRGSDDDKADRPSSGRSSKRCAD
jgi:hypothetical protein